MHSPPVKLGLVYLILIVLVYWLWLYSNREREIYRLLSAPGIWLLIYVITLWIGDYATQTPTVSGYSHTAAWVSMNDTPHPESWQLEYEGENWAFYFALCSPLLGWLVLRMLYNFDEVELNWQMRHFKLLGLFVWVSLFFSTCRTGYRQEYFDKNELPAIGSRISTPWLDWKKR